MSDKILKLSLAQTLYQDLRERINALPTDSDIPEVPVQDVLVNGTSILNQGVANVPIANATTPGTVIVRSSTDGLFVDDNNRLNISSSSDSQIKAGGNNYRPITPYRQHISTFYGLAKASGDTSQSNSSNAVGVYTDSAKGSIQKMLGIYDLLSTEESSTATAAHELNSTFMMDGKLLRTTSAIAIGDAVAIGTNCEVVKADEVFVKTTDYASSTVAGIVKTATNFGTFMQDSIIGISKATDDNLKGGTHLCRPIVPYNLHVSIYYGLSKLAGVDLVNETVTVGTYPETSKTAIRTLIGAGTPLDVLINGTSVVNNGVASIPVASSDTLGVVKIGAGLTILNDRIITNPAGVASCKAQTSSNSPITPIYEYAATFYGLATAAGDTTQAASDNAVGTYTSDASAAIRTMIGTIGSEDYATSTRLGLVKVNIGYGITVDSVDRGMSIIKATSSDIKAGTHYYKPIVPYNLHESVFYALAKAAGDTTQSSSSNTVGTYTTEAKSAIHTMLGIDPASIAALVDIPLVETVSGTTPTITGQPNVRYVCGEVSTISITPPASGSVDVIFESGSTATTMTVPSTVKWPAWFDAEALEADTTYEILITDGIYGSVMTWAT